MVESLVPRSWYKSISSQPSLIFIHRLYFIQFLSDMPRPPTSTSISPAASSMTPASASFALSQAPSSSAIGTDAERTTKARKRERARRKWVYKRAQDLSDALSTASKTLSRGGSVSDLDLSYLQSTANHYQRARSVARTEPAVEAKVGLPGVVPRPPDGNNECAQNHQL